MRICLLLALAALTACSRAAPPAQRLNVVLITLDALRADALGAAAHSRVRTPSIDRMSRHSTVFTTAISSFVGTTAAMPSLMSGLYPSFYGIDEWRNPTWSGLTDLSAPGERQAVPQRVRMLAEILREHGWQTAGFNTNPNLNPATGFAQGFSHYERFTDYRARNGGDNRHPLELRYPPADTVISEVLRWQSGSVQQPFFLWFHLMDPHSPYLPPPPFNRLPGHRYLERSDLEVNEAWYRHLFESRGGQLPDWVSSFERLPGNRPAAVEHLSALYDGEISFADHQLGRLLDRFDELSLWESTVVVLTADHGEEFLEHGGLGHHLSGPAFEELIRVPLLVHLPSGYGTGGKVVEQLVRLVDIVPTVLDYTGLGLEAADMDGSSLRPLLEGRRAPERVALINAIDFSVLRTQRWKYRHVRKPFEQFGAGEAVFDIIADPLEAHDLALEQPDALRELRLQYAEIMTRLRWRGRRYDSDSGGGRTVRQTPVNDEVNDQEVQEQLRHLGYLD